MRLASAVVAAVFLAGVAGAATTVVPTQLALAEGLSNSNAPFNRTGDQVRYQQVYRATSFPGPMLINELRFRSDASGLAFSGTIPAVVLKLSTTSAAPDAMNVLFDSNFGPDVTVVHSGNLTISTAATGAAPRPFDVIVPLQTPFLYDPADGNLLFEFWSTAANPLPTRQLDAESINGDAISIVWHVPWLAGGGNWTTANAVSTVGLVTRFGYTTPNDPPTITTSAPTTATEDLPYLYAAGVTDPQGGPFTWSVGSSDTCGGALGALTGEYAFTPAGPVPAATCVLAIGVCDAATPPACVAETKTVTIFAVNDPPSITSTAGTTATEDVPYAYSASGTDPENDGLIWAVASGDTCGGVIDAAGQYVFTPAGPLPPPGCIARVLLCDVGMPAECTEQATSISIAAVNDPPTVVNNLGLTLAEGASEELSTSTLSAIDPEQAPDALVYTLGEAPKNGVLTRAGTALSAGDTFSQQDVDGGLVSYVHDGGETIGDLFVLSVTDGAGGAVGPISVGISITPVNDAPVLVVLGALSVAEAGTASLSATVAATDLEQAEDALTFTVTEAPAHGRLHRMGVTLPAGGTFTLGEVASGAIEYTHDGTETTADTFSLTLADGAGGSDGPEAVTVTISAVNDAPIAQDDGPFDAVAGKALIVAAADGVLKNDVDDEEDLLAAVVVGAPAHGSVTLHEDGGFEYLPVAGFSGDDAFTYQADDGTSKSAPSTVTFRVTLAPANPVDPSDPGEDPVAVGCGCAAPGTAGALWWAPLLGVLVLVRGRRRSWADA